MENVKELLNAAEGFGEMTLSDFLDLVLLATDEDRDGFWRRKSFPHDNSRGHRGLSFPWCSWSGQTRACFPTRDPWTVWKGLRRREDFFTSRLPAPSGCSISALLLREQLRAACTEPADHSFWMISRQSTLSTNPGEGIFPTSDSDSYSDLPSEKIACDSEEVGYNLRLGQKVSHHGFRPRGR